MAFWLTFLLFAGFTILSELLRPKPKFKNAQPAGLGDFQFPTAAENRRVPKLWGTVQVKGPNVVWYGDLKQIPIKERVKTGLFSSTTITKGYRYLIGIQHTFCAGPIDGLRRMWIGDKLVVDATASLIEHGDEFTVDDPELFGGDDLGAGGFSGTFEFFAGTADQTASAYLEDFQVIDGVVGHTPAYRRFCYIAPATTQPNNPDLFPLPIQTTIYVGNSENIDAPKFELQRIHVAEANPLGLADPSVNTLDANPANVLYEVMIDLRDGLKIPEASIDADSFRAAAATLKVEGNGFSFIMDGELTAGDLISMVEKQIDGTIFFDTTTSKWALKLARDDYDETLVPTFLIGEGGNVIEVTTFSRPLWESTANMVSLEFVDRSDEYKTTFGTAQSDANIEIQEGRRVASSDRVPGVKDGALADALAWRDLRTVSTPLVQARVITDRSTYAVNPVDVVKLTFRARDFSVVDLLMRVRSIDRGDLLGGRITYELVEDVFRAGAGSYGAPPNSGWVPPGEQLSPIPVLEQLAIEAPRALTLRDPQGAGPTDDKVYAAARQQDGTAVEFDIRARHSSGSPSGDFLAIGSVDGWCMIGELAAQLLPGSAVPLTSLTLTASPDTQALLLAAFSGGAPSPSELGIGLERLILVGEEFMLVTSAVASGSDVLLQGIYRGALDSVQLEHAAGTPAFLLFIGAGMSALSIPDGHNVQVKLVPRSYTDTLDPADATAIAFTMQDRTRRPYAPSKLTLGAAAWPSSVSLEVGGTGEADGITVALNRRDFRTENEVASLLTDAGDLSSDFPAANLTTHEVEIVDDPDGSPSTLLTYNLGSGVSAEVPRLEILKANGGAVPTRLRFNVRAVHDFLAETFTSRYDLGWSFDLTSTLTGDFAFGSLDTNVVSALYTATVAGTYAFTLSSSFASGDVEYRLNGGAWIALVGAGTTSGSIVGVGIGDTIEVRHRSGVAGSLKLLTMSAAGAGLDGFAVLYV